MSPPYASAEFGLERPLMFMIQWEGFFLISWVCFVVFSVLFFK